MRDSAKYRKWHRSVLGRDGRCVACGTQEALTVDHYPQSFADILGSACDYQGALALAPLFDTGNGRVLCRDCHSHQENVPAGLKGFVGRFGG